MLEDLGLQDVAADDAEGRRRRFRVRFLDQAPNRGEPAVVAGNVENAVAPRVLARDVHDGDDIAAGLLVDIDHLLEAGGLAEDDVVGEEHGKRLVADEIARAPNRVAEAKGPLLARVADLARLGDPREERGELTVLAAVAERRLELEGMIEMIFERGFRATGHEDEFLDAGSARLLDRVLDQRLVDDREHLLRNGLGRRQEAGAQAADGKHGLAYWFSHSVDLRMLFSRFTGGWL